MAVVVHSRCRGCRCMGAPIVTLLHPAVVCKSALCYSHARLSIVWAPACMRGMLDGVMRAMMRPARGDLLEPIVSVYQVSMGARIMPGSTAGAACAHVITSKVVYLVITRESPGVAGAGSHRIVTHVASRAAQRARTDGSACSCQLVSVPPWVTALHTPVRGRS